MPFAVAFPGKDAAGNLVPTPFQEQLDFFLGKLNLPTERWDDIRKAAHDRAFVVAGAAQADLLQDFHAAIAGAIQDGTGLTAFRRQFDDIVKRHGWTGWTGEDSAAGHAWRTRVIYQTNMSTSYAAGRWRQLTTPAMLSARPNWKYVHSDSVMHPRPLHQSWNGMVLPHDHPFWATHYPPNGWGCECRVTAASDKELAKALSEGKGEPPAGWDRIEAKTGAPVGIDKGWDYAPGARASRPLQEFIDDKLIKLSARIGAQLNEVMQPVLQAERSHAFGQFLDEVLDDPIKRGRRAVVGAMDTATLRWLQDSLGLAPKSAEIAVQDGLIVGRKAVRHTLAGDALSAAEWRALPESLARPEQILYDNRTGKLLYIVQAEDGRLGKVAVEFDFKSKRGRDEVNMIVSAFKVPSVALEADIQGGFLQVVR